MLSCPWNRKKQKRYQKLLLKVNKVLFEGSSNMVKINKRTKSENNQSYLSKEKKIAERITTLKQQIEDLTKIDT